jgi:hypothetical protein
MRQPHFTDLACRYLALGTGFIKFVSAVLDLVSKVVNYGFSEFRVFVYQR